MAPAEERPTASPARLHATIPQQRDASTQEQIIADDCLIEAVRAGRITDDHPDPVVRLLVRWRMQLVDGC